MQTTEAGGIHSFSKKIIILHILELIELFILTVLVF